jgi:hypothetical protein
MAEERNLGTARAPQEMTSDEDTTKEELQRRMEEARDSIAQTVTEIKDTVTNQYQTVRESVSEALDWREQYRRRPAAWSAGALGVGFLAGYSIAGALKGSDRYYEDYPSYDEDATTGSSSTKRYPTYQGTRTYAAGAITGGTSDSATNYRPSYSSGYKGTPEEEKPGLIERFKDTQAFDRLQSEVSKLGDRFITELSNVGQTVVLPALLSKVKDLFGIDLSSKGQSSAQRLSSPTSAGSSDYKRSSEGDSSTYSSGTAATTGAQQGSSYGTSENRDYSVAARDRDEYKQSGAGGREDYTSNYSTSNRDRDNY